MCSRSGIPKQKKRRAGAVRHARKQRNKQGQASAFTAASTAA